jgi:hypothetical protein
MGWMGTKKVILWGKGVASAWRSARYQDYCDYPEFFFSFLSMGDLRRGIECGGGWGGGKLSN